MEVVAQLEMLTFESGLGPGPQAPAAPSPGEGEGRDPPPQEAEEARCSPLRGGTPPREGAAAPVPPRQGTPPREGAPVPLLPPAEGVVSRGETPPPEGTPVPPLPAEGVLPRGETPPPREGAPVLLLLPPAEGVVSRGETPPPREGAPSPQGALPAPPPQEGTLLLLAPPQGAPPREGELPTPGGPSGLAAAAAPSSGSDSDTDSDSSSTTSSSSSHSPSTVSDDDDHPSEKDNRSYSVKTKDELPLDELPPVEDLSVILPNEVELKLFGTVSSIIGQLVIIESLRGLPPVNEDSIIFKEDRQAAGKIFEIFGPVLHPFYVLRFNSSEHIKAKGINVQDSMYFAPSVEDFTQYVFAEKLTQEKGSDASWKNDQEPPPEALDFSDDEKEREAKQKKKKPQNQIRKKLKSETNESNENNGFHQSMQQPASNYSRGYHGRSRGPFPPRSAPPGFLRSQARPPQLYSSDSRMHQESPVFSQPHRKENPMMQQYAYPPFPPPPVFGSVNEMHHLPPSNLNMLWTGPNMYNPSYPFLPPPPPPSDSNPSQFRPY